MTAIDRRIPAKLLEAWHQHLAQNPTKRKPLDLDDIVESLCDYDLRRKDGYWDERKIADFENGNLESYEIAFPDKHCCCNNCVYGLSELANEILRLKNFIPRPTMNKHPETFSVQVPFAGFYGSVHDECIDEAESGMFADSSGDKDNPKYQSVFQWYYENVDHREAFGKYAKAYTEALAEAIDIKLEFEEMVSPREYNFVTDRIFAKVTRDDLAKMLWKVKGERLNVTIAETFTSRSGFISHYPNNIFRWPRISEWDHNHCYAVIKSYVQFVCERDCIENLEVHIANNEIEDDQIIDWLYEAANDKGRRMINLASYLREREDRRYRAPLAG